MIKPIQAPCVKGVRYTPCVKVVTYTPCVKVVHRLIEISRLLL